MFEKFFSNKELIRFVNLNGMKIGRYFVGRGRDSVLAFVRALVFVFEVSLKGKNC